MVISEIDEAIKKVNTYSHLESPKITLLRKEYEYLLKIFSVIGLDYSESERTGDSKEDKIISSIVRFRDGIRENAKSDFKKILEICDKFRDYDMVDLEIRI